MEGTQTRGVAGLLKNPINQAANVHKIENGYIIRWQAKVDTEGFDNYRESQFFVDSL